MEQMETGQPPRMLARMLVIASLVAAAMLLIALFYARTTPSAEPQRDHWAVTLPTTPAGAAAANAPSGTRAAEAASKGTAPPGDMAHALALAPTAIIRDVQLLSRDLGIRCGEVSSDGGVTFKRFFHIDTMKTGRVDDGSEDFRQHAANVCTSRS